MLTPSLILLGLAALVAWTLLYTWLIVKRERPKRRIASVAFGLLLAAGPLVMVLHSDARREAAFEQAVAAFVETHEQAQLLRVTKGPRAWVYAYLNDNEQHTALLVGEDWLEVFAPETSQ